MSATNGTNGTSAAPSQSSFAVKAGLAQMLKGGVIMDVVNAEQACAFMVNSMASTQY